MDWRGVGIRVFYQIKRKKEKGYDQTEKEALSFFSYT